MNANEPSAFSFIDNIPLPKAEDSMTAVQKYWYNKGHEHGRALAVYNRPKVEALEAEIKQLKERNAYLEAQVYGGPTK